MQVTSGAFYVIRARQPIGHDELRFHLVDHPTIPAQARKMKELGYVVIGYIGPMGILYDLDDNPTAGGMLPGDLALQGEQATLLFPKERDRKLKPLEGLELYDRRAVLS